MKKMGLIFSHTLSEEQKISAKKQFGELEFVELPKELKTLWGNIPPHLETLEGYLAELKTFIKENFQAGEIMLVQGDYAATYHIVEYCKSLSIKTVHATTVRQAKETILPTGEVKMEHIFKHVLFREFL